VFSWTLSPALLDPEAEHSWQSDKGMRPSQPALLGTDVRQKEKRVREREEKMYNLPEPVKKTLVECSM